MEWIVSYIIFAVIGIPVIVVLCRRPVSRKPWRWSFGLGGAALFGLLFYAFSLKPDEHPGQMDVEAFAEIPVQFQGRIMPVDTAARTTLRSIRGRESVPAPSGETLHAIDWLLWKMAKPEEEAKLPVFRIDHPEVKALFNLDDSRKYFSYEELLPTLENIRENIGELPENPEEYSVYEQQLVKTLNAIQQYNQIGSSFHPGINRPDINALDLVQIFGNWNSILRIAASNAALMQQGQELGEQETQFMAILRTVVPLVQMMADPRGRLAVIPPVDADAADDETTAGAPWLTLGGALMETFETGTTYEAVQAYANLIVAYNQGEAVAFDNAVRTLHSLTEEAAPVGRVAFEEDFNRVSPFYTGTVAYVLGLVLLFLSWLRWPEKFPVSEMLRQGVFWLFLLTFILHSWGLLARMIIMERPAPVTNLYSSAVFIGWAACGLGLLLEQIYRNSFGLLIAGVIGFCTLIIAMGLGVSGDTMEAMRAVLDSNFWLATHVVTITLGYVPMFIAGVLAIVFIVRGVFFKGMTRENAKALAQMTYGILAFALILSFIGTFLGGVWADQSWGRFWGWDPKENGALMIVLWIALIFHARIGGMIREKGLMVLTIGGSMITAWSWFGTNQLGIGLHSYGFTDSGHFWLMAFWASQLLFILIGSLPKSVWRSRETLFLSRRSTEKQQA